MLYYIYKYICFIKTGCGVRSLVNKDAGLLEAFGKGASEDIQQAKMTVYNAMTYDAASETSHFADMQMTPLPSPPASPKPTPPGSTTGPGHRVQATA